MHPRRNSWIHPHCMSLRFWRSAILSALAVAGFAWLVVTRFQVGVSEETLQSLRASVFLVDRVRSEFASGDYMVFRIDRDLESWKKGTRFVKRVVGVPGDRVVVSADATRVNGVAVAGRLDLLGPLRSDAAAFTRAFALRRGEYFVVGENASSFDSRYWGTVQTDQIIGEGYPLW